MPIKIEFVKWSGLLIDGDLPLRTAAFRRRTVVFRLIRVGQRKFLLSFHRIDRRYPDSR
jgi:hypothetical protein